MVELDGDLKVKAIRRPPSEDRLILVSENSACYDPPEILKGPEINTLRIIGKVVWWGGHSAGG